MATSGSEASRYRLEELIERAMQEPGQRAAAPPEATIGNAYPAPPERRWLLPDLLVAAGLLHPEMYTPGDDREPPPVPEVEVRNLLTCNSKRGLEGALYVCTPAREGDADGHDYAARAVAEFGVVAVLAQEGRALPEVPVPVVRVPSPAAALGRLTAAFYGNPAARLRVVGLLGSHGKTTTAWLARAVLEERGALTGMVGAVEYAIAEDRLTADGALWEPPTGAAAAALAAGTSPFHLAPYRGRYGSPEGTPDPMHLLKALAGACDRGATHAVVELSFAALARDRASARLANHVLVFTGAEDLDEVAPGVAPEVCEDIVWEAVDALPDGAAAVVNIQDALGERVAAHLKEAGRHRVITYCPPPQAATDAPRAPHRLKPDVYVDRAKYSIWETEVVVSTPSGRLQTILPLPGPHNAANVLAAACVGLAVGASPAQIVAGLEAVDLVPGHSEVVDEGQDFSVVVDAARRPRDVARVLRGARERLGAKRVIAVAGAKGRSAPAERAALGAALHAHADVVVLTSDNPGPDWPDRVVAQVAAGFPPAVRRRHAGAALPWLQDPHRVPQWFQRALLLYQSAARRYVVEDRLSAIRVALGMAKARDVVYVLGKGSEDYQEVWDGLTLGRTVKGWFEDRVECRDGLARLPALDSIKDLNRDCLPWTRYPSERKAMEVFRVEDRMNARMEQRRRSQQRLRGRTPQEAMQREADMREEEQRLQEETERTREQRGEGGRHPEA